MALLYARHGANVVITARTQANLDKVKQDGASFKGSIHAIAADLTNVDQVKNVIDKGQKLVGHFDIVVVRDTWHMAVGKKGMFGGGRKGPVFNNTVVGCIPTAMLMFRLHSRTHVHTCTSRHKHTLTRMHTPIHSLTHIRSLTPFLPHSLTHTHSQTYPQPSPPGRSTIACPS